MRFPRFSALLIILPIVAATLPNSSRSDTARSPRLSALHNAPQQLIHKPSLISYREEIEPILKASCGSCHSSDKHASGLVVETPEALLHGGIKFSRQVIVSGKPAQSALIAYLRGARQPRMPLSQQPLTETAIQRIELWIRQGAKIDAARIGWPYTTVSPHPVPAVKDRAWPRNSIDNFILSRLESAGLHPSAPATRISLLRRVYADLIGIPPTPAETQEFVSDKSSNAYEKVVDRLLADPRYGERWGRHWLDLVRFAETHGFENDGIRPRAWRYRDYVIKSFNDDKPYDRFLKEQIAGDEIAPDSADAIVATGFARLGPWDELSTEPVRTLRYAPPDRCLRR